jgi:hypothetical protein
MVALTEIWSSLFVITSTKLYENKKKISLQNNIFEHIYTKDVFFSLNELLQKVK